MSVSATMPSQETEDDQNTTRPLRAYASRATGRVYLYRSLHGVIQGGDGPLEDPSSGFRFGGWSVPLTDESMNEATRKIYDEPECDLLLAKEPTRCLLPTGRTTE